MLSEDVESPGKLEPHDIVILIMGPTGVGKSSIIDRAVGQDKRAGHGLTPCTKKVSAVRLRGHPKYGDRIVLVDTPGFNDTTRTDQEILRIIGDWLMATYHAGVLLHRILYAHRITDNRMSGSHQLNLRMFQDLSGENAARNVLFVTTMWDDIEPTDGAKCEEHIKQNYWRATLNLGASTARFHNTWESAWKILDSILIKPVKCVALGFQEEIVDLHRNFQETKAYTTLSERITQDHTLPRPPLIPCPSPSLTEGSTPSLTLLRTDVVILILGLSGCGKSTFINAFLSEERMTVNHSLTSGSNDINFVIVNNVVGHPDSSLKGRRVVLVDTPGFEGSPMADINSLQRIVEWLDSSSGTGFTFGGAIFLHDISRLRLSSISNSVLGLLCSLSDSRDNTFRRVILTTTMWDRVVFQQGLLRERELIETGWRNMIERGSEVHRFKSPKDAECARGIVDILFRRIDSNFDIGPRLAMFRKQLQLGAGEKRRKKSVHRQAGKASKSFW